MASKPEAKELKQVSLVAGGGLLLVGSLGFLIYSLMSLIPM